MSEDIILGETKEEPIVEEKKVPMESIGINFVISHDDYEEMIEFGIYSAAMAMGQDVATKILQKMVECNWISGEELEERVKKDKQKFDTNLIGIDGKKLIS
jgi:hypothetical protein